MVVVLDEDPSLIRAVEKVLGNLGVEVYADHDPLRWLNVVTDLQRMPDLFLIGYEVRGRDCSAQIEIVRRKWRDQRPKVVAMVGNVREGTVLNAALHLPILQKPLSESDFEWVVALLASESAFPKAGFVCK
jgi:CheY-like chemotaxis protein